MKTTFILILCGGLYFSAGAQSVKESMVPDAAIAAVHQKYPAARDISWESKGVDYKAEFKKDKMEYDIYVSPNGQILRSEEEISKESLPIAVQNRISTDFKGLTIDEATKLQLLDKVYYVVNLKGDPGGDRKVAFWADGQIETNKLD